MRKRKPASLIRRVVRGLGILLGAALASLVLFLGLPLMQSISGPPEEKYAQARIGIADAPPPPPPAREDPKKEEEKKDEKPPELAELKPLGLDQLEAAINPVFTGGEGEGGVGGLPSVLPSGILIKSQEKDADDSVNVTDLDQKPRVIYQPGPMLSAGMKGKAGTVYIIFVVDAHGKVENPVIQKSCDPALDRAAEAAVRQWKFDPGMRNGKAVRFRMRVPIKFQ